MILSEYPHPDHLLVHVSDTHLVPRGSLLHGVANPAHRLEALLARLASTGLRPEALIFTGDLTDRGDEDAYELLRELVDPVAASVGAQVVWVMGNHDRRAPFRGGLLGCSGDEPVDYVVQLGGLRVVVLDTTVPGHHWGEVTPEQRDWLAEVLADRAPEGTILALHHPPVPCVQDLAVTVELRDQHLLRPVLAGSDVRAILGGHLHYSTFGSFAGIPVSAAASTCYTQDLFEPGRGTRGRDAEQAINLVGVYADTVLHSVMPLAVGPGVGRRVDAEATRAQLAAEGSAIRPR